MPLMPCSILPPDMDAFFAAVEQRDQPELWGKPRLFGHDGPRGDCINDKFGSRAIRRGGVR
jgi:hypothetical protein